MGDVEPKRPRVDELREWSDEHLAYEVWMLKEVVRRMAELGPSGNEDRNASLRNSLVESFAVHVRCLREFLQIRKKHSRKPRADDALANDFCDPFSWSQARDAIPHPEIDRIEGSDRIEKEIVHLTHARATVHPGDKSWDMGVAVKEFSSLLTAFAELADSRLGPLARKRIEELASFCKPGSKRIFDPGLSATKGETGISVTDTTGGTIHPQPTGLPAPFNPSTSSPSELREPEDPAWTARNERSS